MDTKLKKKQEIEDMTREELKEQLKLLQSHNQYLEKQLKKFKHQASRVTEIAADLRDRCDKHYREKIRLQNMKDVVYASGYIILMFSLILVLYAIVFAIINFIENKYKISKDDLPWFIQCVTSDKTGSFIIASLGFAVSIPS
jgi:uncharacterized membrane protein YcjF (UPF0283 family)